MAVRTKQATGLKATRSGNNIVFEWKIGDSNYNRGQWIKLRVWNWNAARAAGSQDAYSEKTVRLGVWQTAYTGYINPQSFMPYTNLYLTDVCASILGFRGDLSYNSGWTPWVTWRTAPPSPPNTGVSWDKDHPKIATFSWATPDTAESNAWFSDFERQSILIKDCNTSNGAAVSWAGASSWTWDPNAGSQAITETTTFEGYYSYTRWYRVRCRGPRGYSDWRYERHVYAMPAIPSDVNAYVGYSNPSSGYRISIKWSAAPSEAHPIDETHVEYEFVEPTSTVTTVSDSGVPYKHVTLTNPPISSGTDVSVTGGTSGSDGITFTTGTTSSTDKALAVRVFTKHDNQTSYSTASYARDSFGKLATPTNLVLDNYNPITKLIRVNVTNNSNVENTHVALYYKEKSDPDNIICVGIIDPDTILPTTIRLPDSSADPETVFAIGARTRLGDYSPVTPKQDTHTVYTLSNNIMQSDMLWGSGDVPKPPSQVVLSNPKAGTIKVDWDWSWRDASGAELSWSQDEEAWESTNDPQTYTVYTTNSSTRNISDLDVGTWYVRVRLFKEDGSNKVYGGYSDAVSIKLASAPLTPLLTLSSRVISKDGIVTCYWAYASTDGTDQMYAEVCTATVENDVITYGDIIARATTAQHISISAADQEWQSGDTIYLAVRVTSVSGETSEGWSPLAILNIADSLDFSIKRTSLKEVTDTYENDEGEEVTITRKVLNEMPLEVEVGSSSDQYRLSEDTTVQAGKVYYSYSDDEYYPIQNPTGNPSESDYYELFGQTGNVSLIIERAEQYFLVRPDESEFDGFEGETVAIINQNGSGLNHFDTQDLIGVLDDECSYRLIATITDEYGQTASDSLEFLVRWDHQAAYPSAEIEADQTDLYSVITPIAPTSYELTPDTSVISGKTYYERSGSGTEEDPYVYTEVVDPSGNPKELEYYQTYDYSDDYCDIYRISADKPRLIVSKASFGIKYVDPYPTLGQFGGYRIVYKTKNGDYITDDGRLAWQDYTDDSVLVNHFAMIIDFNGESVSLPYDITVSNKWSKDFTETKYLGGSIQGDWNAGVSRTGTITTNVVITEDPDTIKSMRRLAEYTGICHVRTPDGSSFSANVTVNEDRENKWVSQLAKFSLDITRVDSEGLDGILYDDFIGE